MSVVLFCLARSGETQFISKDTRTPQQPMPSKKRNPEYVRRFELSAETAKWAVTMTKVRIRQATADNPWPHWHILSFIGPDGHESRGVVDLIAVRKDHSEPLPGLKRGDALQIILIQVKGGSAATERNRRPSALRVPVRPNHHCDRHNQTSQ
jgi:hypothetical protein